MDGGITKEGRLLMKFVRKLSKYNSASSGLGSGNNSIPVNRLVGTDVGTDNGTDDGTDVGTDAGVEVVDRVREP